jgi:hypothetical protein
MVNARDLNVKDILIVIVVYNSQNVDFVKMMINKYFNAYNKMQITKDVQIGSIRNIFNYYNNFKLKYIQNYFQIRVTEYL